MLFKQGTHPFAIFALLLTIAFLVVVQAKDTESVKVHSNNEFGFEIGYPSSWTEEKLDFDPNVNTYVVEFNSPPEGEEDRYTDYLGVQIRPFDGSTYKAEQEDGDKEKLATLGQYLTLTGYTSDLIEDYRNTYDNFQNLSFDLGKLGDRHAYLLVQRHTLELPDGKINLKVLETGTIVGDKVYSLHYTAEEDKYSKYLSHAEDMIESFKFIPSLANISNQDKASSEISPYESTSTTLSSFKTYDNAHHGIQALVPAKWEVNENDPNPDDSSADIVYFLSPTTGSSDEYHELVALFSDEVQPAYRTLSDYLDFSVSSYGHEEKDFELISSSTNAEFAGKPAYKLVYTSNLEEEGGDLPLKTMEIGTIIGSKSYYVSYIAEPENYEEYLPQAQQIIDSVKILDENRSIPVATPEPSPSSENIDRVDGMPNEVKVSILAGSTIPNAEGYSPEIINVRVGDIVRWSNDDASCHTVTSGNPGDPNVGETFDSSLMEGTEGSECTIEGKTCNYCPRIFEQRFEVSGEFPYHDTIFPYIQGQVIVTEVASSSTTIDSDQTSTSNQSNGLPPPPRFGSPTA